MSDKSQSGDGYKCSCGFITDDKSKFFVHIGHMNKLEGKGTHKSLGRVDMTTGEITMPPYNQRTKEQREESNFGKRIQKIEKDGKVISIRAKDGKRETPLRTTDILNQASEIRFVPRIFTTTYTPIMMQAQDAAVKYFGWRANMPLENFLDTVLYLYFKEHGITLGAYHVDDRLKQVPPQQPPDGNGEPASEQPTNTNAS